MTGNPCEMEQDGGQATSKKRNLSVHCDFILVAICERRNTEKQADQASDACRKTATPNKDVVLQELFQFDHLTIGIQRTQAALARIAVRLE